MSTAAVEPGRAFAPCLAGIAALTTGAALAAESAGPTGTAHRPGGTPATVAAYSGGTAGAAVAAVTRCHATGAAGATGATLSAGRSCGPGAAWRRRVHSGQPGRARTARTTSATVTDHRGVAARTARTTGTATAG